MYDHFPLVCYFSIFSVEIVLTRKIPKCPIKVV